MFNPRSYTLFAAVPIICLLCVSSAMAEYEPNDDYSKLVVSFQNSTFSNPVCIGPDCHSGVSGPAVTFARQVISNLALGVSGSYLQSGGSSSSIKSRNVSLFAQAITGLGSRVDVGATAAVLSSSLELCNTITGNCTTNDDTGTDLGVFGKVFLTNTRSLSLGLSYDAVKYKKSAAQSVVVLSLVAIVAKQHRFALSVDRSYDSDGNSLSGGYGLGYSFLVF